MCRIFCQKLWVRKFPFRRYLGSHVAPEGDVPKNVDDDCFDKPFNAYQNHLSNIMTVGMLLLGFVLTGTVLGLYFSGEEAYNSGQLVVFLSKAMSSAIAAGLAVGLSFFVSVRALQFYTISSARRGLMAFYNSVISMAIAELSIYFSVLFFAMSLETYIIMVYRGPDICVGMGDYARGDTYFGVATHPSQIRSFAFCGQLGDDLFIAANRTCNGYKLLALDEASLEKMTLTENASWSLRASSAEFYVLCSVFDWYATKASHVFNGNIPTVYFSYETAFLPHGARRDNGNSKWTWLTAKINERFLVDSPGHTGLYKQAFFMQQVDEVTTAYCQRDEAYDLRDRLCTMASKPGAGLPELQACASARQSFVGADTCVAAVQNDVVKCHKTCSNNMEQFDALYFKAFRFSALSFICLAIAICFRVYKNVLHIYHVQDVRREMGMFSSILDAAFSESLGLEENSESEASHGKDA